MNKSPTLRYRIGGRIFTGTAFGTLPGIVRVRAQGVASRSELAVPPSLAADEDEWRTVYETLAGPPVYDEAGQRIF